MSRKPANSALLRAILLPALALAGSFVVDLPEVHAVQKYQYSQQLCTDCHGMPPIDAAYRNVTTGGFQGSHQTHATSVQSSCEKCHHSSGAFTTEHADGFIHMSSNINGSALYGSKGVFFNQTSNPVMGTCTNVNCHFETETPVWSGTTFTSPTDCDKCHGAPPSGSGPGYAGGTAGSHSKHNDYYSGAGECKKCHTDHTGEANKFAHATSQRNIVVTPRDPANVAGGSYSGSGANFLPSRQASQSFGTCSATYCHSDGKSTSGTYNHTAIQWGGSTTCTTCHDGSGTSTDLSGNHLKHVDSSTYQFPCNYCHKDTTANGSTIRTTTGYAVHVNKSKDVAFDPVIRTSTSSWNGSKCENIYCHGNGQSLEATDTVNWTDTVDCSDCHNDPPVSGSHEKHAPSGSSCIKCHFGTVAGIGSFNSYSLHVNRSVDIKLNTGYSESSPTYNGADIANNYSKAVGSGFARCSSLYCHSDGKRNAAYRAYSSKLWGSSSLGCTGCHGNDQSPAFTPVAGEPNYANTANTPNSHLEHVSGFGYTNSTECSRCHNNTVDSATPNLLKSGGSHLDGTPSVALAELGGATGSYDSGTRKCSATYCHGDTTSPAWGTPISDCSACHGASKAGYWLTSTAHRLHWESTTLPSRYANYSGNVSSTSEYRFTCSSCHSPAKGASHVNGPADAKGAAEVFFGFTSATRKGPVPYPYGTTRGTDNIFKWTDSGAGCNTTYCHSDGNGGAGASDPITVGGWLRTTNSSPSAARCILCHTYTGMTTNQHAQHLGAFSYAYSCAKCHSATTSDGTTITGKDKHVNKVKNVDWDATNSDGTAYVDKATNCSNIYCHSDGTSTSSPYGTALSSVKWDTPATLLCTGCHGDAATGGKLLTTGRHQNHVNNAAIIGTNFGCPDCHAKTVSNDISISNYSNHVNKYKDYSGVRAGGSSTYSGGSCSANYCHSSGKKGQLAGAGGYTEPAAPVWTSGSLDCKGCHGGPSSLAGEPTYTGGTSGTADANSHPKHVSGGAGDCGKCHFKTTSTGSAIISGSTRHTDRSIDVNLSKRSSYTSYSGAYNSSARTCTATYCHGGTTTSPAWGGSTQCNTCHNAKANDANWASTSAHKIHWEGTDLPTSYNMTPGNGSADASTYRFACSSCHDSNQGAIHADTPVNANRAAQVFFGFSTIGVKGSYTDSGAIADDDNDFNWTNGTTGCTGTYCHSNGEGQPGNTAVAWGTASKTGYNCNFCHGNTRAPNNDWRRGAPLYASEGNSYKGAPKGNAHDRHINIKAALPATYMQCYNCHAATTQNNTSIADKTRHLNKAYNIVSVVQGVFSSSFRDGDDTSNNTKVTVTYTYSPTGSSCSNVSCHPIAADLTQTPPQPKTRDTSSVKWNGKYLCVDCHNIAMQDTSTFHHAMRNYSSGYPTATPSGDALNGTNSLSRRCTMCHVDHNIFSPDLNTNSSGRSYNLRTDIAVTPTSTTGYTNSDYVNSGTGGICISCHTTPRTKDTSRRRTDPGVTVTPTITLATYSASSHQYMVSAKFMSDNSTVTGDCSKCHNALLGETSVFANATSAYQFGNHNSGVRRLQGSLDAAGGETAEEQICYRCHSATTDTDPGGGPPKAVSGKDFYGVATMSAASEGIFQANSYFRPVNSTSTTNKLFFKPTAGDAGYPAETMPNATTNDSDLGDTFAGGTYAVQSMSPWNTTTAYTTKSQATNQSGTKYWKMVKFVSPVIASATTVPAGTWTINMYTRESNTSQNARIRYMVYKWTSGDAKGATIITKGTYATELATTAAPGTNRQIDISVGTVSLNVNEKIVVDLALETTATVTTSYTAYYYFGSGAPSNLTLPGNITFTYADPGSPGFGHGPAGYLGVHKPSTTDETLATIAQNRHVECNDCHNPHSATNGLADDYGTASAGGSNYLDNTIKRWITNQWAGKTIAILSGTGSGQTRTISSNTGTRVTVSSNWTTNPDSTSIYKIIGNTNLVSGVMRNVPGASASYTANQNWSASNPTYTLVNSSTYEYNVCFKCHAKTSATENTFKYWNVTSASLQAKRWTDIGLEFNPYNQSYHPVVSALPASDPSTTYGSARLTANQLGNGWAPGMLMSCTDCHDSTSATAGSLGPHGSSVKWMLAGPNRAWPYTSNANNGDALTTGFFYLGGTLTDLFCLNCHPNLNSTTSSDTNNVHTKSDHRGNVTDGACVNCHIRVPHGGKVSRLIAAKGGSRGNSTKQNLPSRYSPDGNGGGYHGLVQFKRAASNTSYTEKDYCYDAGTGACNKHSSAVSDGETW